MFTVNCLLGISDLALIPLNSFFVQVLTRLKLYESSDVVRVRVYEKLTL